MKLRAVRITILALLVLCVMITGCKKGNLDELLSRQMLTSAEKLCEDLEGEEQNKAYIKIASFYYQESKFQKAAFYFSKAGQHIQTINSLILGDFIKEAEAYCAEQKGDVHKKCALSLARTFYRSGDYEKAISYYKTAGEEERIRLVKSKIPYFKLLNGTEKILEGIKDNTLKRKVISVRNLLREVIFTLDGMREWRRGTEAETDKKAVAYSKKALEVIDGEAASAFFKEVETLLAESEVTLEKVEGLSFSRARLDCLIKLLKLLDRIAVHREFFTTNSEVYVDSPDKTVESLTKDYNFEQVYREVLKHTGGLFETIEASKKAASAAELADFKHDLYIDMDILDYIAAMFENIKSRLLDFRKINSRVQKKSKDMELKKQSSDLYWEFVKVSNKVLHLVGKKDYKAANELLLSGYKKTKDAYDKLKNGN
ncbi:MAG: hypothetical protein GY757_01950 [bacterium]|nr:hypothetical protein [bacterium]